MRNHENLWLVVMVFALLVDASSLHAGENTSQCLNATSGLPEQSFTVLKRVDKTHYWLRNEANTNASDKSYVVLETHRELSVGESAHFSEVTDLGMSGDFSHLVIRWREGCSEKNKAAADYTKGIWWAQINPEDPSGAPCVNSIGKKYNIHPATMVKATSGGCVVSDGSSPFGMLSLDCTNSVVGAKVLYFRTRKACLQFVSLANAMKK